MLAIVCPGQGSQSSGFLTPWLKIPTFKKNLQTLAKDSELDLLTHGTISDEKTIKKTQIAQPLIVAAGICSLLELNFEKQNNLTNLATGHSVGEITAAVVSGVLDAKQAMLLVKKRAEAMGKAAQNSQTGMSAILGEITPELKQLLQELNLTIANNNGAKQIVVAGTLTDLAKLLQTKFPKIKTIPLKVAGAFHTQHMQVAANTVNDHTKNIIAKNPNCVLLSNSNGQEIVTGTEFLKKIVTQISNPVRWDLCMQTLQNKNITGIIELLPGTTLTNLIKRTIPGIETLTLKEPENLTTAKQFINKHFKQ